MSLLHSVVRAYIAAFPGEGLHCCISWWGLTLSCMRAGVTADVHEAVACYCIGMLHDELNHASAKLCTVGTDLVWQRHDTSVPSAHVTLCQSLSLTMVKSWDA